MFKRREQIDFTKGAVFGNIFAFFIPMMLTGIFQSLFSIADMAVIGKFGSENAFAAIGSTSTLINLVIQLFMGLSVGVTIVISRYFGAKDDEGIRDASHTAIVLSLIGGICLAIIGVLVTDPLLIMMNNPEETRYLAATYIKIYFCSMPMITLYNFSVGVMRAFGDTQRPMYYLMAAGVLNVILNLLFVIVFHWDVAGVALATFISQVLSAWLALRRLTLAENACRIDLRKLRICKRSLLLILRYGIPSGIQSTVFQISGVLIQSSINSFGPVVMAARGGITYLELVLSTIAGSFANTATTACSQNYGARNKKRIMKCWSACLTCSVSILLAVGVAFTVFCPVFMKIFTDDPEITNAASELAAAYLPVYFIGGIMNIGASGQRGIGYSVSPMITTIIGTCVLRVVWVYTVFAMFPTLGVLYACYPAAWIVTGTVHIILFLSFYRKLSFGNENDELSKRQKAEA